MAESIKIQLPLKDADLERLHAGDHVLLSGVIYSARDAAHRRMIASLQKGEGLPFDIRGQTLYYVGPTPARPGRGQGIPRGGGSSWEDLGGLAAEGVGIRIGGWRRD